MKKSSAESRPESSGKAAQNFQSIPSELRALPQWVCWKLETVAGRLTKVPYSATLQAQALAHRARVTPLCFPCSIFGPGAIRTALFDCSLNPA